MQPFEDPKNLLSIFRLDSDAVVLHGKQPVRVAALGANMDFRWLDGTVFDGVSDQILQKLYQPDLMRQPSGLEELLQIAKVVEDVLKRSRTPEQSSP